MHFNSTFSVNDFYTKKQAILHELGFGWLPDYLIENELEKKVLQLVPSETESVHSLRPRLYYSSTEMLGRVSKKMIEAFQKF